MVFQLSFCGVSQYIPERGRSLLKSVYLWRQALRKKERRRPQIGRRSTGAGPFGSGWAPIYSGKACARAYVWLCIYDRSSCPCRACRTRRACRAGGACCARRALNALNALHALRSRRTGRAARPGGALYAAARRAAADVAAAAAAGRAGAGVPVVARSINLHTEKSPFIPFTLSSCGGLHKTEYADRPERVPDDEKTGGPKACRFALFRKIQMFFGNSRSG